MVTHHASHPCKPCGIHIQNTGEEEQDVALLLLKQQKHIWLWRGGWLWIIQSVSHKGDCSLCLDMLVSAAVVKHLQQRTSGQREFLWSHGLIEDMPAPCGGNAIFFWNCDTRALSKGSKKRLMEGIASSWQKNTLYFRRNKYEKKNTSSLLSQNHANRWFSGYVSKM